MLNFEWDPHKSRLNARKHGITFEEAQTVFEDENARLISDPDHSNIEERFIILGLSSKLRVLIVCHCYRKAESVIRIFSARRATPSEKSQYGSM